MILAGDFIPKNLKVHLPDEFRGKLVLANLEGPICADGLPKSNKVGVCLHSDVEKLGGWGVERFAFSLANNHMMDFREEGLRQTKAALASHGIPFAGAGDNEEEARKPMILEEDGKRIAVFCCCERQFGMATRGVPGCAAKGVWLYNAIRNVKSNGCADFVIVSCHAANEFSPWPSPDLQAFYHSLIDAGADCIHGHHAHVPQGYEIYQDKPIFYGLGNFVVDPSKWTGPRCYLWSLVVQLMFDDVQKVSFQVVPYEVLLSDSIRVRRLGACDEFTRYLKGIQGPFSNCDVPLEAIWQETAVRMCACLHAQVMRLFAVQKRRLSFRDRLRKLYFSYGDLKGIVLGRESVTAKSFHYGKVNYTRFNCESHAECIRTALGVLTGIETDLRSPRTKELADGLLGQRMR